MDLTGSCTTLVPMVQAGAKRLANGTSHLLQAMEDRLNFGGGGGGNSVVGFAFSVASSDPPLTLPTTAGEPSMLYGGAEKRVDGM